MLRPIGSIALPPHRGDGGFDHAAVHRGRGLLYVAHTANDAVDVVDLRGERYARSIEGLRGVAGALVEEQDEIVFTSNRGEDTVGIFGVADEHGLAKIAVGVRPNGLAYDRERRLLLAANAGDPSRPETHTVTLVDVAKRSVLAGVGVPGRTRWTVFDPTRGRFLVNIAAPSVIVSIDPRHPQAIAESIAIPDRGPHGLDLDTARQRLYCACDGGMLVDLDLATGAVRGTLPLSGAPDVIFLDHTLQLLYVAIGDPGVVDVIDTVGWTKLETVATGPGAHTLALDEDRHRVYVFLPRAHRAAVFEASG